MNIKNQPAFPVTEETTDRMDIKIYSGLTKREYFAAAAMQGVLSGSGMKYKGILTDELGFCVNPGLLAQISIEIADELLRQLKE